MDQYNPLKKSEISNTSNPQLYNLYHCDTHPTYKYFCQECVKSKNNFWANKRNERIQCPDCGRFAYEFSMENHKNTAYHILMKEIKRNNYLEERLKYIENKLNILSI